MTDLHPDDARDAARLARTFLGIAEGYVELQGMISPERGGEGGGVSGAGVKTTVPVSLHVIDLIRTVDTFADRHRALVRGVLRMGLGGRPAGLSRARLTVRSLKFIADALGHVWADSPEYALDLRGDASILWGQLQGVLGRPRVAAHPVDQECPRCGELSVWVDPRVLRAACGMDDCGWTSEEAQDHADK